MTILYAATSVSDVEQFYNDVGTTAATQAPSVQESINLRRLPSSYGNGFSKFQIDFEPRTDVWISYYVYMPSTSSNDGYLSLLNKETGKYLFNVAAYMTSSSYQYLSVRYLNASNSLISYGGSIPQFYNTLTRHDIHIDISSNGIVEFYVNGMPFRYPHETVPIGYPVDLEALMGANALPFDQILFTNATGNYFFSSIIVADEDTRGMKLYQRRPTADGTYKEWTGSYENVNQTGIDYTQFMDYREPGDRQSFAMPPIPQLEGSEIKAVVHSLNIDKRSSQNTLKLKSFIKLDGEEELIESEPADITNIARGPVQIIMEENPLTSEPFTPEELNGSEMGFQVIEESGEE